MSGPNTPENAKPEDGAPAPETATPPGAGPTPEANPAATETSGASSVGGEQSADPQPAADAPATEVRIAELEAQLAELNDRYLRVHAEMENVRKRSEREKSDVSKYAIANFARDVLGVSDNLKRAISAVATTDEEHSGALKALVEGVELTEQELNNALDRHGVRPIPATGELFDPNVHQAVMEQENKEVTAGSVLQVFQEGYRIGERVLRPSMVVVAKGGPKPIKDAPAETSENAAPDAEATKAQSASNDEEGQSDGQQGAA
jgi:molecular chaperone GrpE